MSRITWHIIAPPFTGGRLPRVMPCGSRHDAYEDYRNALTNVSGDDLILLLVDSEDTIANINNTWEHLRRRDNWWRPPNAVDEDVLLMSTCMETWIVADRSTLREHFGQHLNENALPPLTDLESRHRHRDIQDRLRQATRHCPAPYSKDPKSYVVLGKLKPEVIEQYLPSFRRARDILNRNL